MLNIFIVLKIIILEWGGEYWGRMTLSQESQSVFWKGWWDLNEKLGEVNWHWVKIRTLSKHEEIKLYIKMKRFNRKSQLREKNPAKARWQEQDYVYKGLSSLQPLE